MPCEAYYIFRMVLVMVTHYLIARVYSEKCVIRGLRHCVNIIEYTCINLDVTAYTDVVGRMVYVAPILQVHSKYYKQL